LSAENSAIKTDRNKISENIESLNESHKAMDQNFERSAYQKALDYGNRFEELRNAYVVAKARSTQSIKALEASERQQMSQCSFRVFSNSQCRKRIDSKWGSIEGSHYQDDGIDDLKVGRQR
jgi:hypothetical protein